MLSVFFFFNSRLFCNCFQYQPWLNIIFHPLSVLRFVGPTDNIYSCSFVQMLEQRLENAFDEAQDKVLETYNRLTVEVLHGFMENICSATFRQLVVCRQHANHANNKALGKFWTLNSNTNFYMSASLWACCCCCFTVQASHCKLTHKTQNIHM